MNPTHLVLRIVLAALVGGAIGLERELRDHTAGFRTHIMVCLGSTAFTLVSAYGFDGVRTASGAPVAVDPSRVAAQIVTGIGFLGAGAIIRHGATVRGLTTAASLWTVAAIGMAIGLGLYALTFVTAAAVLVSLSVLRVIEHRVIDPRLANGGVVVALHFPGPGFGDLGKVVQLLDDHGIVLRSMEVDEEDEAHRVELRVRLPGDMDRATLRRAIEQLAVTDDIQMK